MKEYNRSAHSSTTSNAADPNNVSGAAVNGIAPFFRVKVLEEVSSTNDEIKRAIEAGEPEGLAVRARRQTGGYGRQGRIWASPDGGLYCSLLLRPQVPCDALPTLSLAAGIAVHRALTSLMPKTVACTLKLKWPNDLVISLPATSASAETPLVSSDTVCENENVSRETFVQTSAALCATPITAESVAPLEAPATSASAETLLALSDTVCENENVSRETFHDRNSDISHALSFAKICGISLEAHAGGICVGIGINVFPLEGRLEVPGKNAPAYLADFAPYLTSLTEDEALSTVADALLRAFADVYATWLCHGFAALLGEYNKNAILTGQTVRMVDRLERPFVQGKVVCVDAQGRLVLTDERGTKTAVSSGEAHIV